MSIETTRDNLNALEAYKECLDYLMKARDELALTSEGYDGRIRREIAGVEGTVLEAMRDLVTIEIADRKGE